MKAQNAGEFELFGKGSFGFVEKIMQDPDIHELWENDQEKEQSVMSILCEGEEFQSSRKYGKNILDSKETENSSKFKSITLEQELSKKNLQLSYLKEKLFQCLGKTYQLEKNMKLVYNMVYNCVISVNSTLQFMKVDFSHIEELLDHEQPEENHEINSLVEYLKNGLTKIQDKIHEYKHQSQFNHLLFMNQKLTKKNISLEGFIHKRKQYTQSLKGKIEKLKNQNQNLLLEIESKTFKILQYEEILEEANNFQLSLEMKYANRNELMNLLKNLLKKILNHQSKCSSLQKLTYPQLESMKRNNSSAQLKKKMKQKQKMKAKESPLKSPMKSPMRTPPLSPVKKQVNKY